MDVNAKDNPGFCVIMSHEGDSMISHRQMGLVTAGGVGHFNS
jgi:hypothetical protein